MQQPAPITDPAAALPPKPDSLRRYAIKDNRIQEIEDEDEIDFEIPHATSLLGTHGNLVPLQSNVQAPRVFFGAKFYNQALPVTNAEAPWVQSLDTSDPEGRSFDEILGKFAGALRSDTDGEVIDITPDSIKLKTADGEKEVSLYNSFLFNRKSSIHQTPTVKLGDKIKKGALLARSNYTDDKGTLAMGLNARIAVVPYKGYSMDDATVISESFAKRLAGHHTYAYDQDFDDNTKPGKGHFVSLFPDKFKKEQLDKLDDKGVVKPGMVLQPGDPMILATRPRTFSSTTAQLGKLSKSLRQDRTDGTKVWEEDDPGVVTDVAYTRNGVKVVVHSEAPAKVGDKVSLRSGQKGVISLIIPDEHMPRTTDGKPLEMLLNPQGMPSRVNSNAIYEILLGKIAKARGKAYKLPGFSKDGKAMYDMVEEELAKAGISPEEEVFDPESNRKLENPVLVGEGYVMKLSHTASSKYSDRGIGAYSKDEQPAKGSGPMAGSKRFSGLETYAALSSGAYKTLREMSTIRGAKNDAYWRDLKMGLQPKDPGVPFVFKKFRALLTGAGLDARDVGEGNLRLGPITDRALANLKPIELKNGDIIDPKTMEPVEGGLFDPALVQGNKWAKISLPTRLPNPAFEDSVRKLLGLTKKQFEAVMAGKEDLPDELLGLSKQAKEEDVEAERLRARAEAQSAGAR